MSGKVATAETIHDRYKNLAQVERAFRTFKSGLEVRPSFVRKEESTRDELGSLRGIEIIIGSGTF